MIEQTSTDTEYFDKIVITRETKKPLLEAQSQFLIRMDQTYNNAKLASPDRITDYTLTKDRAEFVVDIRK